MIYKETSKSELEVTQFSPSKRLFEKRDSVGASTMNNSKPNLKASREKYHNSVESENK